MSEAPLSTGPAVEPPSPVVDRLTYRPSEVAQMTGLSEPFIYKLIADGEIPSVRVGRSICVLRDDLVGFMQARRTAGGAS